jgi:hypothetical protein
MIKSSIFSMGSAFNDFFWCDMVSIYSPLFQLWGQRDDIPKQRQAYVWIICRHKTRLMHYSRVGLWIFFLYTFVNSVALICTVSSSLSHTYVSLSLSNVVGHWVCWASCFWVTLLPWWWSIHITTVSLVFGLWLRRVDTHSYLNNATGDSWDVVTNDSLWN